MTTRTLFATRFYEGDLGDPALLAELEEAALDLSRTDRAGRAWCKAHAYPGYTSYASLNDLPIRHPAFDDLRRALDRHVRRFADEAYLDLGGRKPKLDSLWVNVMKGTGGHHSGHIHPHSIVSGTVYVRVPTGAAGLKLEDPRLPMMMAAPLRRADAPEDARTFVYADPRPGSVFLWESWLRHEVPAGQAKDARISISFNYR
ncbi:TIGR02466 family protein [Sphingomonas naphthae]|uniref:TIGR02466 family protein n=1 Tax=Sphingomonas naphthae TaxID=1813468 RepID=A0ABY7TLJ5_9SPHN|nr:TIGR02466 family protein [Sphingomonas naphthae]WCT73853.1 TIGR02466 family protein [Sphingomonas naphthae]